MTGQTETQRMDEPNLTTINPEEVVERYEDEGFEISVWVTNPTRNDDLDVRTYRDEEVFIRLSNTDNKTTLELVDSLLQRLESDVPFSLPNRSPGDTYEIVVKPTTVDESSTVSEGKTSMRAYLTEDDSQEEVQMLEEVLETIF